jgi:sulfhydrogenase subunit beta (sulfur reductase)
MSSIKRKTLIQWLDKTAQSKDLVAPRDVNGVLLYRSVPDSNHIVWDYIRPVLSAKDSFFPATERLLTIEKTGQTIRLNEVLPNQERVIFGIRPCDARGIAALDALFINTDPIDRNYAQRRQNSVIIGLACSEIGETCFCTSTGGSPDDTTGMDILLKENNGDYKIQVLTEKGLRIAQEEWGLDSAIIETEKSIDQESPIQEPEFTLPEKSAWPPQFNDKFWEDMAERCLSCRICAYVCPTCRCFDVRDESIPSENGTNNYERIRCWDSCASEVYRRIAGGHNPRAEKGQRLRNRFFCKFYYYPEQYGPVACTGCGRCIDSCPVNIDITEVMGYVRDHTG